MQAIPIASVELDSSGRLAVRPEARDESTFEFVYRAAWGVRWRPGDKAFIPYEVGGVSPDVWYGYIVESVREELGVHLHLTASTQWVAVPQNIRLAIESIA